MDHHDSHDHDGPDHDDNHDDNADKNNDSDNAADNRAETGPRTGAKRANPRAAGNGARRQEQGEGPSARIQTGRGAALENVYPRSDADERASEGARERRKNVFCARHNDSEKRASFARKR